MPNTAWMQGGGWQLGFLVTKGNRAAQRTPFPGFWSRNTPKHVLLMLSPGFLTLTRLKESDGTICNSHAWPGRHRDGTSQYQSLAMTDDSTRHCLGPQNMGTLLQPLQEASPGTRPPDPNKGAQNRVTWWNAPPPPHYPDRNWSKTQHGKSTTFHALCPQTDGRLQFTHQPGSEHTGVLRDVLPVSMQRLRVKSAGRLI